MAKPIRQFLSIIIVALFLAHAVPGWQLPLIPQLEVLADDVRTRLYLDHRTDDRIVIVDIDEASLTEVGQWPWPRTVLAQLVTQLHEQYQVKVIGFDMVFAEADDTPKEVINQLASQSLAKFNQPLAKVIEQFDGDQQFAQALKDAPTVMGLVFKSDTPLTLNQLPASDFAIPTEQQGAVDLPRPSGFTANLNILQEAGTAHGFFDNPLVDGDGIYRRASMLQVHNQHVYPALALQVTRLALDNAPLHFQLREDSSGRWQVTDLQLGRLLIPVGEKASLRVPYLRLKNSFNYISAAQVLAGSVAKEALENKIVLIGTTAPGLKDIRPTPVNSQLPGVEVHASIISGILDSRIPFQPSWSLTIEIAQLLLIGFALLITLSFLEPIRGMVVTGFILTMVVATNLYFWQRGIYLPIMSSVMLTLVFYLFNVSWSLLVESRNKRFITRVFGQYIPPELVDEMADRQTDISIQGEAREMTVLFSDVQGFTAIAENLQPQELTKLMNDLLTPLTAVIHQHRGTIDKYMGDAIMAFWGAPLASERHSNDAVRSAWEMQEAVAELHQSFASQGLPPIGMGIGLNTGPMFVGNMGSEFRMAYTVMGDAVNLGSRLEGLTRQYDVSILVSESTQKSATEFSFREIDRVIVKGKQRPITIFEPLGPTDKVSKHTQTLAAEFHEVLRHYRQQEWAEALRLLHGLLEQDPSHSGLYQLYLDRVQILSEQPPPADWDGVFVFTSK